MKQLILVAMLMFALTTTVYSGGDATAPAPVTTTKTEMDWLKPTAPLYATFDDSIPSDTVYQVKPKDK